MTERVLATVVHDSGEEEIERTLRPGSLAEFVGQERVKEQLGIALDAARGRGEALDHVLLAGSPSCGWGSASCWSRSWESPTSDGWSRS